MTSRRNAWIFAATFWALFGLISGIQVWLSMITHGHSVPLLLGYHVLVWEGWLLPTIFIVWLARRYPIVPPSRFNILIHFLTACAIAIVHGFLWLALLIAMKPYDRMTAEPGQLQIAEILFARLPLEWTLYCLVLGAAVAYDYYERYRANALRAAQLEASLTEAKLHALELQIQPHFLFNTMNAISSLVRNRRNDEAVTMLAGLSDLLRYTLDHAGHQRVALEEELAMLRRYLEIQRTRFVDRMTFAIDVTADAGRGAVPALLLQPLAENAIRHGLDSSASSGEINVRAFREDGHLRIELFNSGRLIAEARPGIGLSNTRERLQHLYGPAATFDLVNVPGGVKASLSIPWSEMP
jgi:two-component system, LytTR family, sensor kinase